LRYDANPIVVGTPSVHTRAECREPPPFLVLLVIQFLMIESGEEFVLRGLIAIGARGAANDRNDDRQQGHGQT
jgi:hypothetical protein